MNDYATFLKDLSDNAGVVVFAKDRSYQILDENEDDYFIQMKPGTNQVSQLPKSLEGELFTV